MKSYLWRMNVHCFPRNLCAASHSMLPLQPPSRMETHLWYISPDEIKSSALLNQYMELLSPSEKENVFRMSGDQLRKSAILARALVRTTIARYQINQKVDPKSLKFRKNNFGKPEVDWETESVLHSSSLNFNISHTSSLIACGVAMGSPVGIDVEEKQRRTKNGVLKFAQRYFSPHEIKFLTAISDPESQRQEFLKLWTLKEAYVKALGRGFSAAPFKSFSIHFRVPGRESHYIDHNDRQDSEIIVESLEDPVNLTNNWQFSLLELAGSHYAAVCMERQKAIAGKEMQPVKVKVWKTIPFVEDELQSGTDAVKEITGLLEPLP